MSSTTILPKSVLWITDVFDQSRLDTMLGQQEPAYIVNDHFNSVEKLSHEVFCVPLFLARDTNEIVQDLPTEQTYQTQHTFNFMINKKQINRFLCMKLVEMFNLTNYDYTWSGVDSNFDLSDILDELSLTENSIDLTAEQKSILLAPITIPAKFFAQSNQINNSHIEYYSGNSWTWNHGLNNIFSCSVVSLITESLSFQKSTVFTEKTSYAVLGKTFPIWVGGGIKQAQVFEEMGFDAFNDVIDHSYQNYDTLIERCYYAFERNLHILTDFEYASKIRESMMSRLDYNQQLLKNKHVDYFCRQRIGQWPAELQQAIVDELKKWI
jgi:hypothetical protein